MKRRVFIRGAASAAAAAALPAGGARASSSLGSIDEGGWRRAFARARGENAWLLGWEGARERAIEPRPLEVHGDLPRGLAGSFLRVGPAVQELGGLRCRHWTDGDGMVQEFRFDGEGGVSHRGRVIETRKFKMESRADKRLVQTLGTSLPRLRSPREPDEANVANTNLVMHGGEILALWDGGSPWRIDPRDLRARGPRVWSESSATTPFGAHPKPDSRGGMWSVAYDRSNASVALWHIDAAGRVVRRASLMRTQAPWIHDFGMTDRWLILALPPLREVDASLPTFWERLSWDPSAPTEVWLVDRNSLQVEHRYEMPAFWNLHFGNAWEESGMVFFEAPRYPDPSLVLEEQRMIMRGEHRGGDPSVYAVYGLDLHRRGRFFEERNDDVAGVEWPTMDPRMRTRRHGATFALQYARGGRTGPRAKSVLRLDPSGGVRDSYILGVAEYAEEHIFAPRPGGREEEGWLIGTALDLANRRTVLHVFDAERLSDGPLAEAVLPDALPFGQHGIFVPDA